MPVKTVPPKRRKRAKSAILSSCSVITDIFKKYFWLNSSVDILAYGMPEDDIFFDKNTHLRVNKKVRQYYDIPDSNGIILYMPTFRDSGKTDCYDIDYARIIKSFE